MAPGEQGGALPAIRRVEHPHDPFLAARRHPGAVGAEGDRSQLRGVLHPEDPLAARRVPDGQSPPGRAAVGIDPRWRPAGGRRATRRAQWTQPGCLRTGPRSRSARASQGRTSSPRSATRPRRSGSRPGSRPRIGPSGRSGPSPGRSRDPRSGRGRPPRRWRAAGRPGSSSAPPLEVRAVRVPRLMVRSSRPLPVSQTRIVPSSPRVARRFPSGRKATARTNRLCPTSSCRTRPSGRLIR